MGLPVLVLLYLHVQHQWVLDPRVVLLQAGGQVHLGRQLALSVRRGEEQLLDSRIGHAGDRLPEGVRVLQGEEDGPVGVHLNQEAARSGGAQAIKHKVLETEKK